MQHPQSDHDPGHKPHTWRDRLAKIGAPIAVGIAWLAKAKGLLFLLHVPFISFAGTLGLSLWIYVVAFGWRFALVLVLVLLVHELGHFAAFRSYGLPARLPNFIPFLGAFTVGQVPDDLEHDAYIALAGPLVGLGLAAACVTAATASPSPIWVAVAYFSAFLNLLNMIPFTPFDGGRMVHCAFPPAADPRKATLTGAARLRILGAYLGTAVALLLIVLQTHYVITQAPPR